MWKQIKCDRCNNELDSFDYNWNGGICDFCNRKRIFKFVLLFAVFGLLIGNVIGFIEYNFEINKCDNLNSKQSNYDFSHTVETNAQYNSHCYYLVNHPLAKVQYRIGIGLLIGFMLGMLGIVVGLFCKPSPEKNIKREVEL